MCMSSLDDASLISYTYVISEKKPKMSAVVVRFKASESLKFRSPYLVRQQRHLEDDGVFLTAASLVQGLINDFHECLQATS